MNEVYILIISKEKEHEHPEIEVSAYRNMDSALKAYSVSVDEARIESEEFGLCYEDKEIATESYRYFRIASCLGAESITIEVQTKEIIGEDSDDI